MAEVLLSKNAITVYEVLVNSGSCGDTGASEEKKTGSYRSAERLPMQKSEIRSWNRN